MAEHIIVVIEDAPRTGVSSSSIRNEGRRMHIATTLSRGSVAAALATIVFTAQAQQACVIAGPVPMPDGKAKAVQDCIASRGMAKEEFAQTCNTLAEVGKTAGGQAAKVTFLAACPAGAQGVCEVSQGGISMAFHYSGRSAQELGETRKSCTDVLNGRWR
jgi:hypothetical protein